MAGKGGKGLLAAKTTAANKDKDKKKPISRSARAGLQVRSVHLFSTLRHRLLLSVYEGSFSEKVGCEWFITFTWDCSIHLAVVKSFWHIMPPLQVHYAVIKVNYC